MIIHDGHKLELILGGLCDRCVCYLSDEGMPDAHTVPTAVARRKLVTCVVIRAEIWLTDHRELQETRHPKLSFRVHLFEYNDASCHALIIWAAYFTFVLKESYQSSGCLMVWWVAWRGAWEAGWGSQLLDDQRCEAVLGTRREDSPLAGSDSPLAGSGTEGHLDQQGRERRAGLVGDHRSQGSHTQGGGNSRPEVRTAGHGSRRTLEGSLTWTFHLWGGKLFLVKQLWPNQI